MKTPRIARFAIISLTSAFLGQAWAGEVGSSHGPTPPQTAAHNSPGYAEETTVPSERIIMANGEQITGHLRKIYEGTAYVDNSSTGREMTIPAQN